MEAFHVAAVGKTKKFGGNLQGLDKGYKMYKNYVPGKEVNGREVFPEP